MLRLLLDEHISPQVAVGIRLRDKKITVRGMAEWENGSFLGQEDSEAGTFLISFRFGGRKAVESIGQQASSGSFDYAP